MGARLRGAGFDTLRIIESGGDVGGCWNRYPGAMCDFKSYCYLPLLRRARLHAEAQVIVRNEILEHSQRIARHSSPLRQRAVPDGDHRSGSSKKLSPAETVI